MRALLVSHDFLPRHAAGTEIQTWQLAKGLQARGHEVQVFTTEKDVARPDRSLVRRTFDGIPVHELVNNLFYADFRESWEWAPAEHALGALLDELRPDVVHVMHLLYLSVGCVEEARRRGIPVVYTLHDYWLQCARFGQRIHADGSVCHAIEHARCGSCLARTKLAQTPLERRAGRALAALRRVSGIDLVGAARAAARLLPARAPKPVEPETRARFAALMAERDRELRARLVPAVHAFLAPSRFLLEAFRAWGIPAEKLRHEPYGIDLAPFAALQRRPAARPRVRFLGTFAPHKAPHLVLEAWERLAPELRARAELWLHGSRAHFPDYVARCQRLAERVGARDGGEVARERVPALLAETELLVVPSVWFENSPLVIHEALAARTPLLVSDFGGMAELVTPGRDGWRFAVGDAAALARALERALEDPAALAALPFDGVRPRDLGEAAEAAERLYREALEADGAAAGAARSGGGRA